MITTTVKIGETELKFISAIIIAKITVIGVISYGFKVFLVEI